MSSDYKLILLTEGDNIKIRYKRPDDQHWKVKELSETTVETAIDLILKSIDNE